MSDSDDRLTDLTDRANRRRWVRILFVLLAPLSLPGYLLVHAWLNIAGACYYLVLEGPLARFGRRPICLPAWAVYLLSPIVVGLAPAVAAVHAAWAALRGCLGGLVRIGRWQSGTARRPLAVLVGLVWVLSIAWIAVACIDPRAGWRLLGREMPGLADFQRARDMRFTLAELPPVMQRRRAWLLSNTPEARDVLRRLSAPESSPLALAGVLEADEWLFAELPAALQHHLAGLPWYYRVPEHAWELAGRAEPLLGPLFFAILLMVRWPGLRWLARGGPIGLSVLAVRVGLALGAVAIPFAGDRPDVAHGAGWVGVGLAALLVLALLYWLTWKASGYWRLPRQYSPFLAVRLLQRKRIAFFSLGAVTLCVAMVLIVVSVMGGFLDMVRERSHRLLGDLVMDAGGIQGFPLYEEFIGEILRWPEIEAATPVIYSYGLLRLPYRNRTVPVQVVGIRLDQQHRVTGFRDLLFYDEWYPGTTHLGEQAQPVYGLDAEGRPVLPEELERALRRSKKWQQLQADPAKVARYTRLPFRVFPGPGVYAGNDFASGEAMLFKPAWRPPRLPGIIIGRDIIATRTSTGEYYRSWSCPRGCKVTLTLLPLTRRTAAVSATGPQTKAFRYVDDSRTGIYNIDSMNVYVDFDLLQELLEMGRLERAAEAGGGYVRPRCSQIQIRVAPGYDLQTVKTKLQRFWQAWAIPQADDPVDQSLMSDVQVQTWEERQRPFISAVEKEKILMLILFGVISVVAIFLILCIFYMIVMEKTRDIGIIKSVGGSAGGVAAVFLSYGAAIGVVGAALGVAIGTVFVRYINEVQDWLARLHPELRVWKADVYSFDYIPNTVKFSDAAVIAVIAVLAAVLGALVPAIIAARKHPVEALRYE